MNDHAHDGAQFYEDIFVKALFERWVDLTLDAAEVAPGDKVLDVGCGTGVLARHASVRVGGTGQVCGIDSSPEMLGVAQERTSGVDLRIASVEEIPFADGHFDAVVCQFSMMFFEDRMVALGEMCRVLRPGGRMGVAVWSGLSANQANALEIEVIEKELGEEAANAIRVPFSLGNPAHLQSLFERSGLSAVKVQTKQRVARFPSVRSIFEAHLRGWFPVAGIAPEDERVRRCLAEGEKALRKFATSTGEAEFPVTALIVSALN